MKNVNSEYGGTGVGCGSASGAKSLKFFIYDVYDGQVVGVYEDRLARPRVTP